MAQTRRRQRGAGGCVSKPGSNVCVENPIAAAPIRKTKEEVIAEIKAHMLKIGNRLNQSRKNRNELREKGRTAYHTGNRMTAKSMLVRSKLREQAIERNLQSQQFYKTMLTRLGNKKGGDPSTLNPLYGLAAAPKAIPPVAPPVVPQVAPVVPQNVSTRNPLHVAAQTKTLREYYDSQIATAQAKLEEVNKALGGLPPAGTPREIPGLRKALEDTVKIYEKQLSDLKARRPVGGKR
jgi:hypothetical protein